MSDTMGDELSNDPSDLAMMPSSTQTENPRNAFCSSCGTAFAETRTYPRICTNCGLQMWANPIPVSVVLVPVVTKEKTKEKTGLLVVRRAIEPRKGLLALVGGFLEEHETWQQGGVREIREETGIIVDPETLEPFWYASTEPRPNRVLLFSIAKPISEESLVPLTPNHEVSERGLVFGPEGLDELFAFSLHAEATRRFFRERGITGNAGYVIC
jgi:ADP-ribose pyrophosphatase YjhB (NUDIX family)